MADLCVTNNRVIGSGQYASEPGGSSTRAGNWSTSSSCQVRVAWADNATLRYFFNAGGRIYFTSDISSGTSKNNTWKGMISSDTVTYTSAMGTVTMDYTATACTGSGTTTSIGALDLTTSYQTIFTKYAPSGVYSENYFRIQAKFVDTNYNSIDFYILWQDDDAVIVGGGNAPAPGSSPGTPYGNTVDEAVTGTLDFAIGQYRPSGSNVSVTGGSYSTIAEISGS
jgi:hypothetical protein